MSECFAATIETVISHLKAQAPLTVHVPLMKRYLSMERVFMVFRDESFSQSQEIPFALVECNDTNFNGCGCALVGGGCKGSQLESAAAKRERER